MPSRPRKRATEATKSNGLLDAVRFVGSVLKDQGQPLETHIALNHTTATAFNGVVAAGALIEEDIYAAPNNKLLIEALSKCGENLSITQLDNDRLSIKSDKFKALVPCLDPTMFPVTNPDNALGPIEDTFKAAINSVGVLADAEADRVVAASILMAGGSVIATNGQVMFEAWHGQNLPTDIALPKNIIQPLIKAGKNLLTFGFSKSSFTFYFQDNSWLRTQLFAEPWPDIRPILDGPTNPFTLPGEFWQGLDAVAPFSPDGAVHFEKDRMQSHASPDLGASYDVPGLPRGPIFSIRNLQQAKPYIETADFFAQPNSKNNHIELGKMLKFFGKNIRGVIVGRTK